MFAEASCLFPAQLVAVPATGTEQIHCSLERRRRTCLCAAALSNARYHRTHLQGAQPVLTGPQKPSATVHVRSHRYGRQQAMKPKMFFQWPYSAARKSCNHKLRLRSSTGAEAQPECWCLQNHA